MHTQREKANLLKQVRRIGAEVKAVQDALMADVECGAVLRLVARVHGATNGLLAEVVGDHIRAHVLNTEGQSPELRSKDADDVIDILRAYIK